MDWSNETTMEFLELYQMHPCIWDPKDSSHKNKNKVNEAWEDIANNLGEQHSVKDLKRKKESLMSAYRLNRTKIKKSVTSGADEIFQPTWFAYEFMDNFLGGIYSPLNTEVIENPQQDDSNTTVEDAGDTKYVIYEVASDPLNLERESFTRGSTKRVSTSNQGYLSSRQTASATTNKRRQDPEVQPTENQIAQAIKILNTVTQQQSNKEDECYYFGKLIEKKMRKLPEDRRDLMMIKINQLLYEEQHENKRTLASNK